MRSIMRLITILFILFITCLPLLAQLPDFYDPLYDFEKHILKPKDAKVHHVLSCTITQNGKFQQKLIYDGNGHVISDGQTKHIYRYNENGKMDYIYNYDADYNDISTTDFSFNSHYDRESILEDLENSQSGHKYTFYYDEGTPVGNFQEIVNMEDLELTEIKTQYGYSESGELTACKISKDKYKYPGKVYSYAAQSLFNFIDGSLDNAGGWIQDSPEHIVYESFKYYYDDKGQLLKIQNSIDSSEFKDLESYSYYTNGLLKTRSTQDAKYEYTYEFMNTARVNIEIQDDIPYPKLYQYWRNYEFKRLTRAPGTWHFDIYLPDLEVFILELSSNITYPFILEPGKTVNIKYVDGKFVQLNNDPANNLIWEIENDKSLRQIILTKEKAEEKTKQFIVEKMIKHSTSPVFMYYSWLYDLRYAIPEKDAWDELADYMAGDVDENNNIKLLKNHAMDMINRYPYNPLAIRQYSLRK